MANFEEKYGDSIEAQWEEAHYLWSRIAEIIAIREVFNLLEHDDSDGQEIIMECLNYRRQALYNEMSQLERQMDEMDEMAQ